MIAVIGGPAQSQLGQITGADDQSVIFIRHIHQNLGTLAGLRIFISNVGDFFIVADVAKMLTDSLGNIDGEKRHAQMLAHFGSVGFSTDCGAETGHRHGDDVAHGAM